MSTVQRTSNTASVDNGALCTRVWDHLRQRGADERAQDRSEARGGGAIAELPAGELAARTILQERSAFGRSSSSARQGRLPARSAILAPLLTVSCIGAQRVREPMSGHDQGIVFTTVFDCTLSEPAELRANM
jgi:hypothetical protein